MFSALIIALSPFIASAITGLVKKLPPFASLGDTTRPIAVRLLAAAVSLFYILAGMYVTGSFNQDVLMNEINVFTFTLIAWLGSLGVFHAFFQKVAAPLGVGASTFGGQ